MDTCTYGLVLIVQVPAAGLPGDALYVNISIASKLIWITKRSLHFRTLFETTKIRTNDTAAVVAAQQVQEAQVVLLDLKLDTGRTKTTMARPTCLI